MKICLRCGPKFRATPNNSVECDGLLPDSEKNCEASRAGKRGREPNDNDSGKKKQDREEKVQEIVENLK